MSFAIARKIHKAHWHKGSTTFRGNLFRWIVRNEPMHRNEGICPHVVKIEMRDYDIGFNIYLTDQELEYKRFDVSIMLGLAAYKEFW